MAAFDTGLVEGRCALPKPRDTSRRSERLRSSVAETDRDGFVFQSEPQLATAGSSARAG